MAMEEPVEVIPTGTIIILANIQMAMQELLTTPNPTPTGMKTLGLEVDVLAFFFSADRVLHCHS